MLRWKRLAGLAAGSALAAACAGDTGARVLSTEVASAELDVAPASASDWRQLASRGSGPTIVNASAYVARLEAVVAAFMPDYGAGELWGFSLKTNRWRRLRADQWPQGKYRRLVHDPARRRLMTYWDGLGQVYSIPDTGGTWSPDGAAGNQDHYYEAYSFFNPLTQRLNVFGGYGLFTFKDQWWEWDGTNWSEPPSSVTRPEPRFGNGTSSVAVDSSRMRAYLGQRSLGTAPGNHDDLWGIDLRTGNWRKLIPATTDSTARIMSALAFDTRTGRLYRFGGCAPITDPGLCSAPSNDLRVALPSSASVSWKFVPETGPGPSARYLSGLYVDAARRRLILVSGHGVDGWQDDIWVRHLP